MAEGQRDLNTDFAANSLRFLMPTHTQSHRVSADKPEINLVQTDRKLGAIMDFGGDYNFSSLLVA
jgi:hypothetical protein